MDERELVERCRKGERDAQRELYERTAERIYGLLLKLTQNADDAFDLTQDTYLRAFSRMSQFDGSAAVATWLYRIAVNQGLQFLRSRRTAQRGQEQRGRSPIAGDDRFRADARLDVDAALAALPPEDRAILLLRYHDGLDYQTIAEVAELAAGTVASRLSRARARLRELLPGYESREETAEAAHPTLRPAAAAPRAVGLNPIAATRPELDQQ